MLHFDTHNALLARDASILVEDRVHFKHVASAALETLRAWETCVGAGDAIDAHYTADTVESGEAWDNSTAHDARRINNASIARTVQVGLDQWTDRSTMATLAFVLSLKG